MNISATPVKKVLIKNNIHIRGYGECKLKFKLSKEELKELLETKTQMQIARELHLNTRTVHEYKNKFNL